MDCYIDGERKCHSDCNLHSSLTVQTNNRFLLGTGRSCWWQTSKCMKTEKKVSDGHKKMDINRIQLLNAPWSVCVLVFQVHTQFKMKWNETAWVQQQVYPTSRKCATLQQIKVEALQKYHTFSLSVLDRIHNCESSEIGPDMIHSNWNWPGCSTPPPPSTYVCLCMLGLLAFCLSPSGPRPGLQLTVCLPKPPLSVSYNKTSQLAPSLTQKGNLNKL